MGSTLVLAALMASGCAVSTPWGQVDVIPRPPVVTEPTPASPTPNPTPTPPSVPSPGLTTPTATPTHAPTPTPGPTVTPAPVPPDVTPTPAPCNAPPPPPETPVSLAFPGRCPRGFEPLAFEGESGFEERTSTKPAGHVLCAAISQQRGDGFRGSTAHKLGEGIARGGMLLVNVGGKYLQKQDLGCTDAYGRYFPDCVNLYQHDEGPTAPYTWGGYSLPMECPATPTPTVAGPTPTRAPTPITGESCATPDGIGAQVVCTVAFLGWNDRAGIPPTVVVGGEAVLDITCRRSTSVGDGRGQPVDRFGPEWCEPERDPVVWSIRTPGGVNVREFNDGYGLALDNLQAGSYRIEVAMRRDAMDRKGHPIVFAPWGHGSSTRTVLEWEIR